MHIVDINNDNFVVIVNNDNTKKGPDAYHKRQQETVVSYI